MRGQALERQRLPGKPDPRGILAELQLVGQDRRIGGRCASPGHAMGVIWVLHVGSIELP
jgi:hypothetical protein